MNNPTFTPTRRLFRLLILFLPIFLAGIFFPPLLVTGLILDVLLVVFIGFDYQKAVRGHQFSFSLQGHMFFSIGQPNPLELIIQHQGPRPLKLEIITDVPESWEILNNPLVLQVEANENKNVTLSFRPLRRGVYRLKYIHYRYKSVSRFLYIYGRFTVNLEIEVFPDIKEVNRYLLLSRRNRLAEMGIHKNRYRGRGTNLEYLREYQEDDDSRRIDWKASTRNHRLVCKEYQVETNNQVAIILDCGRLMTAEQKGMKSLDYSVNAALILSYVAHQMGDLVTVFAFADKIIGELPPVKGKHMLTRVLQFITRLQPSFVESNYQLMFEHLRVRLKRRSLVILFTDIIDDINYQVFYKQLSVLNRKHLPLIILLRDTLLMENADLVPGKIEDVYRSAAAAEMFLRRVDVIKKFRQKKINLLDLLPHEVTPSLIDKYLELKSRNLV